MSYEERFNSVYDKIHRRSGHIAVAYKGTVIVWGGYMEHLQETPLSPVTSEYHYADEIWMYNLYSEIWERVITKGDIPPRNSGSCGVILEDKLYVFGGYHGENDAGSMNGNSNQIYKLDLNTMVWEWLHPTGTQPTPCDKLVGWEYKKKLYFFGGFGPPPSDYPFVPFQHTMDVTTQSAPWPRGWSNQFVCYNPGTDAWEWPKTKGVAPLPRAAHAADKLGSKVYIFGGRFLNQRMNDLHCLDMESLLWSGNLTKPFETNPPGRSWHSFTFVSPNRAVLYGGLNQTNMVLKDCWQLDFPSLQWRHFEYIKGKPRVWHKAQYLETGDLVIIGGHRNNILDPIGRKVNDCWLMTVNEEGEHEWREWDLPYDHGEPRCFHGACLVAPGEVLIHSGLTQPYYLTYAKLKDHAEEMLVLNFSPKTLLRLCLDTALKHAESLKEEWHLLPHSLENLLRLRLEQWNMW